MAGTLSETAVHALSYTQHGGPTGRRAVCNSLPSFLYLFVEPLL